MISFWSIKIGKFEVVIWKKWIVWWGRKPHLKRIMKRMPFMSVRRYTPPIPKTGTEYIRDHLREEAWKRRIMPPDIGVKL